MIIEDDKNIAELIEFNLRNSGYNTICAQDANEGLIFLSQYEINLILLDLMLPGLQGEEFLTFIRNKDKSKGIPVIIVTAKTDEELLASLLEKGADDFLIKPFSIKVLLAKVSAVLRRAKVFKDILSISGVRIDKDEHAVYINDQLVDVTKTEFDILELFISNPNRVFNRETILQHIWRDDDVVGDRTVDVHIYNLRKKLGEYGKNIKSIPRVGYKFLV